MPDTSARLSCPDLGLVGPAVRRNVARVNRLPIRHHIRPCLEPSPELTVAIVGVFDLVRFRDNPQISGFRFVMS